MTLKIDRTLLPKKQKRHRYLFDDGHADYLGQFLIQLGHNVDGKFRTPQDLGKLIPPFTQACRGSYVNSKLTLDILALDHAPTDTHPRKLEELLAAHNIELVWV